MIVTGHAVVGGENTVLGGVVGVIIGSNKPVGLAFWTSVIAALAVLEVISRLGQRRIPGAAELIERYLHHPVIRTGAIGLWLFAGWHLFAH